jgi:hypothetical protein
MFYFIHVALFGWIPVIIYLFKWLTRSHRQVVAFAFVFATLFLPVWNFPIPGLPALGKYSATCYGVVLGTLLFDPKRFLSFRPSWVDIPMVIFCLCPFITSVDNDLGAYDGVNVTLAAIALNWVPYFFGRIFFNDLAGLRLLATYIFAGSLFYIPLCFIENFIGPKIHLRIYGVLSFFDVNQAIRYGGYRPVIFMNHGLVVAFWMMSAAIIGLWLWRSQVVMRIWNMAMKPVMIAMLFTVISARSTGAWIYLAIASLILFVRGWARNLIVFALIFTIFTHLYLNITGQFQWRPIVEWVAVNVAPDRAQSLEVRFSNEEILAEKARKRIVFGWGGWGRSRVPSLWDGVDYTITDSTWVMVFGTKGLVGLASWAISLLLPVILFLLYYPGRLWLHPKLAPVAALATILTLAVADHLLNTSPTIVCILMAGGLNGLMADNLRVQQDTGVPLGVAEQYLPEQYLPEHRS